MNVVCIGGGHGLGQQLAALKHLDVSITAIVATTDNGGSTGKIRQHSGSIAWGDIRRCINILAGNTNLTSLLMEHRFENLGELSGHSLGNLMLQACESLSASPSDAAQVLTQALNIPHMVIPMTNETTEIRAICQNGDIIQGECQVDEVGQMPEVVHLTKNVSACKEARHAILDADLLLIGPGSIITSVLPALLVDDIKQAVAGTNALRVYCANLTPEKHCGNQWLPIKQLEWMNQQVGFQFYDRVLLDSSVKNVGFSHKKAPIMMADLVHARRPAMHDYNKLMPILDQILAEVADAKSHQMHAYCA